MVNLNGWRSTAQDAADFDPDVIIGRDSTSLVLGRGSSDLAAQTVRIVTTQDSNDSGGVNSAGTLEVVIIGDSDLDVKKGDLFKYAGTIFKVFFVNSTFPGQVQARARGEQ